MSEPARVPARRTRKAPAKPGPASPDTTLGLIDRGAMHQLVQEVLDASLDRRLDVVGQELRVLGATSTEAVRMSRDLIAAAAEKEAIIRAQSAEIARLQAEVATLHAAAATRRAPWPLRALGVS